MKRGFFKLHMLADLDTRRIPTFCVTDMNGGDAAQLSTLLNEALKKHVDGGIEISDAVGDLAVEASKRLNRGQTLPDSRMPGYADAPGNAPEPAATPWWSTGRDDQEILLGEEETMSLVRERLKETGIEIRTAGTTRGPYSPSCPFWASLPSSGCGGIQKPTPRRIAPATRVCWSKRAEIIRRRHLTGAGPHAASTFWNSRAERAIARPGS